MFRTGVSIVPARVFAAMMFFRVADANAGEWFVSQNCSQPETGSEVQPFCDIQTALDIAEHKLDTVWVGPGTYDGPLEFPGKSIRVLSTHGAAVTHIVGVPDQPVINFDFGGLPGSQLTGFTVRGGRNGIYSNKGFDSLIQDCVITDNDAESGAGIRLYGGDGIIRGCTIAGNEATGNGGGILILGAGWLTFESCIIENNRAANGAGMYVAGPSGGSNSLRTSLTDCIVRGNTATGSGGGITFTNDRTIALMYSTTVFNNRAKAAAGMDFYQSRGSLYDVTIEGNIADEIGGGLNIKMQASPMFFDCTIHGNRAELFNGGGMTISAGSYPYFENCVISGNFARNGGGVYSYDLATPRFYDCVIEDNVAEKLDGVHGYAGGVALGETEEGSNGPKLERCIIRRNRADSAGGIGHTGTQGKVVNCTIEDNTADSVGGGILCNDSALTVISSLLHRNTAGYGGGAFYAYNGGNPRIIHCTVVSNVADNGGGMYAGNNSQPDLLNSIFWRNRNDEIHVEPDSTVTASYSTIAGGGWPGEGNSGVYPIFSEDGFRLKSESEAINSGAIHDSDEDLIYDLDGHPRVFCEVPDRGAYEFGIGDYDCDRLIDLSDFAFWDQCASGPESYFGLNCQVFDFNGDYHVDLLDLAAWTNSFDSP